MSSPPSDLPPPPPAPPPPASTPTRIAGQEHEPTTQVPMGQPGHYVQPATGGYNSMAVVSLGAGILAFFGHLILPFIGGGSLALVALIAGYVGRQQIRASGESGMWMANVGLILGIVHFALLILLFLVIILLVFVFGFAMLGFHR